MKEKNLKRLRILALIVLAAVFLFPPADYIRPGMTVYSRGFEMTVYSRGFEFIGDIGGYVVIRYPQWVIQLLVIGIVAAWLMRLKGSEEK